MQLFSRFHRGVPLAAALLLVVFALALSACGSSNSNSGAGSAGFSTSSSGQTAQCPQGKVHFAKTKFVLHAGLAAGLFYRYIYKPLRAGGFSKGANKRTTTFLKAAGSSALVIHELKLAREDALADKSLCKYMAAIQGFGGSLTGLVTKLRGGNATSADLSQSNSSLSSLQSQVKKGLK